jgi:aminopeptidase N
VVGHEYFHNWTGNRVTCRDWFQLSLKEGLTVFRDQEFSQDLAGASARAVKRIEDVRVLRTAQFPEDAGPMAHPVRPDSYLEINNFYTVTIYEKGAEVVRMMQTLVGSPQGRGFAKGMALYFERHDGQAVTCDDFAQAIADANPGSPLASCCPSSSAGTARPARRACAPRAATTPRAPLHAQPVAKLRAHAGPAAQGALRHPGGLGPAGAGRQRDCSHGGHARADRGQRNAGDL